MPMYWIKQEKSNWSVGISIKNQTKSKESNSTVVMLGLLMSEIIQLI